MQAPRAFFSLLPSRSVRRLRRRYRSAKSTKQLLPPLFPQIKNLREPYVENKSAPPSLRGNALMSALRNGITRVAGRTLRRRSSSRATPSYMYLNYVQVVNTRGSSAFPNRRLPSCRGPRWKINCVADPIQHHKFSNNRPSWFLRHRGRSSGGGSSPGRW